MTPMRIVRLATFIAAATIPLAAADSFEDAPAGPFERLERNAGIWTAEAGDAAIHTRHAKSGSHSLRFLGGDQRTATLALAEPVAAPSKLTFWTERWTAQGPFEFSIEAADATGAFREIWRGDDEVRVGGFLTKVEVPLATGTRTLRFRATTPASTGVMIDDVEVLAKRAMQLKSATTARPEVPALVGKAINPVLGLNIRTEGSLDPLALEAVEVEMAGTTRFADVRAIQLLPGEADPSGGFGEGFGDPANESTAVFSARRELEGGENWFWVSVTLNDDADLDGGIAASVTRVKIDGEIVEVTGEHDNRPQRIGIALRQSGDDGSNAYRIPGLVRTNEGTLIAAYDVRYNHAGDLPANIDVGVNRSSDGGRTWSPMRIAMDMGEGSRDGVGDPCVFVDRVTGRIWIAALWSHGNNGWNGSGPGMTPEETGQLVLVHSDDDGRTWSEPANITRQVKDPAWRLLLCGPGTGITLRDGTLVFPGQFRAADGLPWSTLIWSKDRGETWHIGTGVKSNTTEAQLVELADGTIMINCRDNRGSARTVAVTDDLGESWTLHPTDRQALPESVCMASLLRWDVPGAGPHLFFSNPATTRGRHTMTVKVSHDEGMTWPESRHTIYDVRRGSGYSCLAPADDDHLGVLYEGPAELYFLRLPVTGLLGGDE